MSAKRLFLIDATAFCYRAYYGLKGLSTSFGQPTNAIYGFINILNKIVKSEKPDYLAACFDVSRDTFRTKKFAEYKIHRPPMPDGLSSQIPLIKEIVSAYGITIFEKEGFEADDVIASLSRNAKAQGLDTVIVSSDKDILQLVDEQIKVFSPYKDEGITYDQEKVLERFGVPPERIGDIIALGGDDTDNIPGAPGIGEKTAVELIRNFGSLEQLLKNIDKIKQEKTKKAILENLEQINLSRELAQLEDGLAIDFNLERLKINQPDIKELIRLFRYLEFKKFLSGLVTQEELNGPVLTRIYEFQDAELKEELGALEELFLYGSTRDELVFYARGKIFRVKVAGENLSAILEDASIKKVSHNLKAVKLALAREGISLEGLYFDTMIASYLLQPSKPGYSLGDVAWDYLALPAAGKIDNHRAIDLIAQLRPKLESELKEKELIKLFRDLEMPLVEVLSRMEQHGIKLDLKILKGLSEEVGKKLLKLIDKIYQLSGSEFNINSPKQLREILFEKLKLPVGKKSKTGPSTNEEVLRKLADKHELPALLLEYRQLTKLKNTYIDALPALLDPDTGMLHTSFNQAGTETGRLSSSNPNLQNLPVKTEIGRKIRQAIIASEEKNCLLSCDYSQIELRILAHLSKDQELISAFKQDKDIHSITASLIYGLEEKEVTDSMREVAKRVNFGIVYGLSSYGLSHDLNIPVEEAQDFIDAYFRRYPKVAVYIKEQIKKAQTHGFVTTLLGRRRYIPQINDKNQGIRQFAERKAVNTPIQGTASDLIKLAMVEIDRELRLKDFRAAMVLQIHDELVFDLRFDKLNEVAGLVKERMENVLKLDVPIKVEMKSGKNWLEMEEMK